jgi:Carbohydrate family 9 binding domain-like
MRRTVWRVVLVLGAVAVSVAAAPELIPFRVDMQAQSGERPRLSVRPVEDFEVTGTGEHAAWQKAEWVALRRRQPESHPYDTRFKTVYSTTGLYFLMEGTDRKLTATINEDFMDLWNEDVFEVFLWTDERYPVYFEYEISPFNHELPIIVPNFGGQFLGWRPWHYERERLTRKATSIIGGPKQSQAVIEGWRAEFFIPYQLLRPLQNVPPKAGTKWRANFYRMDHDEGKRTQWEWAPVGNTFHEFQKFGELLFVER